MPIQSGQSGLGVLVSEGADQFDPDSLLDEELSASPLNEPTSVIAILAINPPMNLSTFQVGGILESLKTEQGCLVLNMTVLLPLALELSRLVLMTERTVLTSIELLTPERMMFLAQPFHLSSVQFDSPLNNRVKMTVLFKPYEHH